jgi:uncharacterized repeat protein (TIGR01451 family)
MKGRRRSPLIGLLVGLGCVAALAPSGVRAQPYPPQGVSPWPGEPPLAGAPGEAGPLPPGYGPPQATGPVDPPTPVVAIKVRVPAQVTPGQDVEYRILVENVSTAAAHHVRVRNPLPANATFVKATPEPTQTEPELQWQLQTLEPGARKEIVLVLKPTGGDLTNSPRVSFEHGQKVTTRISQPALQVRITGPAQAAQHDQPNFRIEVTNSGRARATDVVVTDTLPEGLEFFESAPRTDGPNPLVWKVGTLEAGQTWHAEYSVIARATGRLSSKVVVKTGGGLSEEKSNTLFVGTPKLALTQTGPERRLIKRPAVYLLTVSNPGDMPANHVEVSDEIPEGIEFLSASAGGRPVPRGRGGMAQVKWSLGTLPPGASRLLQLVVRAAAPGEFVNVAAATADHDLNAKASTRTRFEEGGGLSAEIDKGADPLDVGRDVTYQVRLFNAGKASAQTVRVVVTVPEELRVRDARGPMGAEPDRQTVKFAALQLLRPGAEAVYSVYAQALKPGAAKLRVEVTSAETGPSPLTWEETVTVHAPAESSPPPAAK